MSISRLLIVSVPVTDQDRALDFYVNTLGFRLITDVPMGPEARWVQVAPPQGDATLTLVTWFPAMAPGSVKGLVLECSDIRATMQELEGRGIRFTGDLDEQPYGTFVTFDDPDDNGWVLMEPPAGTGA